MAQIRSQAVGNSVISYIGIILGYLNMAVLFPRLLSQEVLGLMQVLISAMLFISNLGSLGLQYIIVRYFPIFKQRGIGSRVFFSFAFSISVGAIILINFALLLFGDYIKAFYSERATLFADYFHLLFPLVVFGILSILLDAYSRAIMKSVLTAIFKEVVVRVLQLVSVLLFVSDILSLTDFLWLYTLIQGLYVLMMYVAISRFSEIKFDFNFSPISKDSVKDIAKFGGVSMFSTTTFLSNNSDILLVGSFVGLNATAVYGVASAIGRVIGVPSRSLTRVASSVIAQAWSEEDYGRIERVYAKSAINSLIISGALFLAVVINTPLFLSLIPESYLGAGPVIAVLALTKVIQTATGISGPIIASSKDYWVNMMVNTSGFIILLGASYMFIEWYGMIGAAYGMLFMLALSNIARYLFLKVKYGMGPFSLQNLWVSLMLLGLYLADLYLPHMDHIWIDSILRTVVLVGGFIATIHLCEWSKDFSEMISGFLRFRN